MIVRVKHFDAVIWRAAWDYIPRPGEVMHLGTKLYEVQHIELYQPSQGVQAEVNIHVAEVTAR
jgi:hypothetical protein